MIECIDSGSNKLITVGNEYEVISETDNRYVILNDKGIQKNYSKNLFKEVEYENNNLVEEIDVETDVYIERNEIYFNIKVKMEGFDDFIYGNTVGCLLDTDISCGIKQISGLNDIMSFEKNFRFDFSEHIEENNIDLGEEIDLDDLFNEVIASLFSDLLEKLNETCLYVLLSTNLNNNENYNDNVVDVLNNIAENETLVGDNPNSGNDIQLWVLKCS